MSLNWKDIDELLDDEHIGWAIRKKTLEILNSSIADSQSSASSPTNNYSRILTEGDGAVFRRLINSLKKSTNEEEREWILRILINDVSAANSTIATKLVDEIDWTENLLKIDDDKNVTSAKLFRMLLSNLTVVEASCEKLIESIGRSSSVDLHGFVRSITNALAKNRSFSSEKKDEYECALYSAYVLRNLTQSAKVRRVLIGCDAAAADGGVAGGQSESSITIMADVLTAMTKCKDSTIRLALADVVRNCCFDTDLHKPLITLGHDDLLVALLYPLIGGEELKDYETESLPIDLQYMDAEKQRESNPAVRLKLLEALYQLCAKSEIREYLRDKGTYYVLREYHKWELDREDGTEAELIVSNVVGVLIRTEDEMACDNLRTMDVDHVHGWA